MTEYTIYDEATGDVVQTGSTSQPETIPIMLNPGQGFILERVDYRTHRVIAGVAIAKPVPEVEAAEIAQAWNSLRAMRTRLLTASDWTQIPDSPVNAADWTAYRQALRDLPDNTIDPRFPVWPTRPA